MILLLDAHALVWWLADLPPLSADARAAIQDPANDVVVSAATIWELSIKRAMGKIDLGSDLAAEVEGAGFSGVPVTMSDGEAAGRLPMHHRDPFDRLLVAQAARLEAVIVTRDDALAPYGVSLLRA